MTDYSIPYNFYEYKWLTTKPIRGRREDVRPIGKRTRDHETVVRIERDGVVSYGAKLYDTVCVEYFPDDTMIIRCGGWDTPSTAEFITNYGFYCWKQYGKLWVRLREGEQVVPVTKEGVKFVRIDGRWQTAEPIKIQKSVIDRTKAKEAREPLMPFINFVKTFLTLSEGWVMHETCKQVLGWRSEPVDEVQYGLSFVADQQLYDKILREPNEETYLFALCCFAQIQGIKVGGWYDNHNRRVAEEFEFDVDFGGGNKWRNTKKFFDIRLQFEAIKREVYKWVDKFGDVRKVVEVTPTSKAMTNVR